MQQPEEGNFPVRQKNRFELASLMNFRICPKYQWEGQTSHFEKDFFLAFFPVAISDSEANSRDVSNFLGVKMLLLIVI